MSQARPIRERELLIDDEVRSQLSRAIDPQIDNALSARGYTEERAASGRIYLDASQVMASTVFRNLYERPFDGLSVSTTYDVIEAERTLSRATIDLSRIGGFSTAKLTIAGNHYFNKNHKAGESNKKEPTHRLSERQMQDVLQDIRAHTDLGYSSSDTQVPVSEVVQELEGLHTTLTVDQRAHYQLLTSAEHGDIQMNIGRSFELRDVKVGDRIHKRRYNMKRLFEIIARQPLESGSALLGVHYRSGNTIPEVKISANIEANDYSEDEKQALYDEMVRTYQEIDINKFGRGVLRNLSMISSDESDIIRLG